MRPTSRALVSAILISASSLPLSAAETGSRWWPFGSREAAPATESPSISPPSQTPLQTERGYSALNPSQPAVTPATPLAPAPSSSAVAPDGAAKESWMLSSPNRKIGWPRLTKPQMPKTGLFAQKSETDAGRNTWVEPSPPEPKVSPLQPIKDGAQKMAHGTKKAWNKTVDALTPGEPEPQTRPNSSRIARGDSKPSVWQRMFGEKEEVQSPQTIPEWMSQKRVDRR